MINASSASERKVVCASPRKSRGLGQHGRGPRSTISRAVVGPMATTRVPWSNRSKCSLPEDCSSSTTADGLANVTAPIPSRSIQARHASTSRASRLSAIGLHLGHLRTQLGQSRGYRGQRARARGKQHPSRLPSRASARIPRPTPRRWHLRVTDRPANRAGAGPERLPALPRPRASSPGAPGFAPSPPRPRDGLQIRSNQTRSSTQRRLERPGLRRRNTHRRPQQHRQPELTQAASSTGHPADFRTSDDHRIDLVADVRCPPPLSRLRRRALVGNQPRGSLRQQLFSELLPERRGIARASRASAPSPATTSSRPTRTPRNEAATCRCR